MSLSTNIMNPCLAAPQGEEIRNWGTLCISNGVYEGDLSHDSYGQKLVRHGQGTMKYDNGNVYIGEWHDDCFDGFGEYVWKDGRRFIGSFKKDKIEGRGVGMWPDGRKYEGEYKTDLAHGHGFVCLPNGQKFLGIFAADFPIEGEMIDSDGSVYSATFDGCTHVSEWKPRSKVKVGRFEEDWTNPDPTCSLREFEWVDGQRFAGSFIGFSPAVGVLTDADGCQHLVSYSDNTPISRMPSPAIKIKLKTKVCILLTRPHFAHAIELTPAATVP